MTAPSTLVTPRRIRLSRARGWRKPTDAVVVTRSSRWGNPFAIRGANDMWVIYDHRTGKVLATTDSKAAATVQAVVFFRRDLRRARLPYTIADVRRELAGRDLACWCPLNDGPCHADVLLELANTPEAAR